MNAILIVSKEQAKILIAKAIARRLKETSKRVYFAYGYTNQLILNELGYEVDRYFNGYIAENELRANRDKDKIIVLNSSEEYIDNITATDIVIKGANALVVKEGKYRAGVSVASSEGGTYGNIIIKASAVGAKVIIPVSHEKLVSELYNGVYTQNSFDITMGLPIALFEYDYGEIFTEIEAFKELYSLEAKLYIVGSLKDSTSYYTFIVSGEETNILSAKSFLEENYEN